MGGIDGCILLLNELLLLGGTVVPGTGKTRNEEMGNGKWEMRKWK